MEIGSKLKNARQQAEYTQDQVANQLKVSRQTISRWENNKSYPDLSFVIKMSEMYNLSLDALLKENTEYTNYIKENTSIKKLKIHLSVIIEVLIYFIAWLGFFTAYHLLSKYAYDGSGLGYTIIVFLYILPPVIFLFSAVIGADPHWGKFKWFMIPILGFSISFLDICTFGKDSLLTGGDIIQSAFNSFCYLFLPFTTISLIGMLIGYILLGIYRKKKAKKEAIDGTGS